MKHFAIDYGSKRIGTAVSNAEGTIAFPRTTVANDAEALATVCRMIAEEKATILVVGDTLTISGSANPVTEAARAFAAKLEVAASVPLYWAREAGSTMGAAEFSGEAHDDASAAAFILQRYLDMQGSKVE